MFFVSYPWVQVVLLAIGLLTGFSAHAKEKSVVASKPNVVLFFADDLSWFDVGAYGNKVIRTPNVDQLAREGLRFTRMFTATAMCAPSRSMLFTGLYPHRNGCYMNHGATKKGVQSLPHYLKPLGYRVALAEKVHVKPVEVYPFEYLKEPQVEAFLQSAGTNPFCLIYASNEPHGPHKQGAFNPQEVPVPPFLVDTENTRKNLAAYYTDIGLMDNELGKLIATLKKNNQYENTLFIFASDHGSGAYAKWSCYEAGLQIPFIVRWPGKVAAGSTTDAMASLVDVLPALMEAAGSKAPENLDGQSILPLLLGKKKEHREVIFGTHTNRGIYSGQAYPIRSIRTQTHKYIMNLNWEQPFQNGITHGLDYNEEHADGGFKSWKEKARTDSFAAQRVASYLKRPAEELYDLRTDPWELHNLAADPGQQALIARLRGQLQSWMKAQGDKGMESEMAVPLMKPVKSLAEH